MQPIPPDLVERARAGEPDAQTQLLQRLQPILRRYFERRIGPRDDVNDLVQNTLVRVHTGLASLKDDERLQAFAMKAALFELQDFYRGRYSSRETLYDPERPPDHVGDEIETGHLDAERFLSVLTPHARRILELRAYGYRYEEIAETLATTEAAVKMQVKRAFDKMRGIVGLLLVAACIWALHARIV